MPAVATKVAHDPKVIARLQAEASRRPGAYRLRLAAIAIAGDGALTITQVLPWAVPIVFGAFFVNMELYYWLGGAAIVLLAWILRPTFRVQGRELAIDEAPRLYEDIAALKQKLRVLGRMHVHLDESFNASATETRGLFGLLGTRCVLTLGVPLLIALSREQVLAVIAHEFGHFSRRHGRLGHWLYRAGVGWIQYAQYVDESDSPFDRAAAWYAREFVPFFSIRNFVHSRQCEYEADADAAHAVGVKPFAEALTRIAVFARLWGEHFPREVVHWQLQHAEPPHDFYERFARFAKQRAAGDLRAWLEDALRAPSSWHDTHPSLSERLRSMAQEPAMADPVDSAAQVLFGEHWPKLLSEFNGKWVKDVRPDWLVEHLRLRQIAQPLLAADEATARNWGVELRLARARALRGSDAARGFAELRDLYQAHPSHKRLRFAYAAALLNESDGAGVELMEALAREDPAFRAAAFLRVLTYFERKGDSQQIERWSGWLKRVSQSLGEAVTSFVTRAEAGEGQPTSLPAGERAVICEATRLDPCVGDAWLLAGCAQFRYAADRPAVPVVAHLLALAINPAEAERLGQDEESIAERYERLLGLLMPPDQLPVVRTYFTTESIPAAYSTRPDLSLHTDAREEAARAGQPSDSRL